jgi:hypothetical protein
MWVWKCCGSKRDLRSAHRAVKIWPWAQSPVKFRYLSHYDTSDIDWVALVPRHMGTIPLLHAGTRFGPCKVSRHRLRDGRVVRLGAHA